MSDLLKNKYVLIGGTLAAVVVVWIQLGKDTTQTVDGSAGFDPALVQLGVSTQMQRETLAHDERMVVINAEAERSLVAETGYRQSILDSIRRQWDYNDNALTNANTVQQMDLAGNIFDRERRTVDSTSQMLAATQLDSDRAMAGTQLELARIDATRPPDVYNTYNTYGGGGGGGGGGSGGGGGGGNFVDAAVNAFLGGLF